MSKKTVAVDFDGVLNTYDGWQGEDELFEPAPGVREFLDKLCEKYKVVIYSTRSFGKIAEWLAKHELLGHIDDVAHGKPRAHVYLDDRTVRFEGSFEKALFDIDHFEVWWKKGEGLPDSS